MATIASLADSLSRRAGQFITSFQRPIDRANRVFQKWQSIIDWFKPGNSLYDIFVILNHGSKEKEKLEAANRLADGIYSYPIAKQRWKTITKDLYEQAELHGQSWETELKQRTITNLFIAVREIEEDIDLANLRQTIRTKLNEYVTDDIIQDKYWQADKKLPYDEFTEQIIEATGGNKESLENMIDIEITLLAIMEAACLSDRERSLLSDDMEEYRDTEIADRHGMSLPATKTAISRAKKKIKNIM